MYFYYKPPYLHTRKRRKKQKERKKRKEKKKVERVRVLGRRGLGWKRWWQFLPFQNFFFKKRWAYLTFLLHTICIKSESTETINFWSTALEFNSQTNYNNRIFIILKKKSFKQWFIVVILEYHRHQLYVKTKQIKHEWLANFLGNCIPEIGKKAIWHNFGGKYR